MVETALLLGSDYTDLGEIGSVELSPAVSIALSRGRFPKGYPHLDPNEDAVLGADDGTTLLAAVVDGHNGFEAGRAVIERFHAEVAALLDQVDPVAAVSELMAMAARAVGATSRQGSGLAVSVCVVRGSSGAVATVGDTTTLIINERGPARLGSFTEFFRAGKGMPDPSVSEFSLRTGDRLVMVTDGVVDFAGKDPLHAIARAVIGGAPSVSQALVELGFAGGAGDNLAAAVLIPLDP